MEMINNRNENEVADVHHPHFRSPFSTPITSTVITTASSAQRHLRGLPCLGLVHPLCLYATFLINFFLSYPTVPSIFPDPFFRIFTQRMYKAKHGSDSMSYDNEGRFRPQNFEDFFAKYDKDNKGGLTVEELWSAWKDRPLCSISLGGRGVL
jgi:hypothetical protein